MTDEEITRLCAEAMGGTVLVDYERGDYRPLDDDAQAFALVEQKFLEIKPHNDGSHIVFLVRKFGTLSPPGPTTESDDLKRAICTCVAKIQEAARK